MTLILVGIPFLSFHFITYLEKIIQAVITKAENDFFGPRSPQYYSFNLTVLYAFLSGTGLLWFLPNFAMETSSNNEHVYYIHSVN